MPVAQRVIDRAVNFQSLSLFGVLLSGPCARIVSEANE